MRHVAIFLTVGVIGFGLAYHHFRFVPTPPGQLLSYSDRQDYQEIDSLNRVAPGTYGTGTIKASPNFEADYQQLSSQPTEKRQIHLTIPELDWPLDVEIETTKMKPYNEDWIHSATVSLPKAIDGRITRTFTHQSDSREGGELQIMLNGDHQTSAFSSESFNYSVEIWAAGNVTEAVTKLWDRVLPAGSQVSYDCHNEVLKFYTRSEKVRYALNSGLPMGDPAAEAVYKSLMEAPSQTHRGQLSFAKYADYGFDVSYELATPAGKQEMWLRRAVFTLQKPVTTVEIRARSVGRGKVESPSLYTDLDLMISGRLRGGGSWSETQMLRVEDGVLKPQFGEGIWRELK